MAAAPQTQQNTLVFRFFASLRMTAIVILRSEATKDLLLKI